MSREAVGGSQPRGAYSPGIVAEGRTVYVSGQGPLRDGVYVPGTIAEETRLTLDNLVAVLREAGSGPEHVVRCGVWLADIADFDGMNAVYAEVFPDPKPARATVQPGLVVGRVEIDCIALVP